MNVKIRRGETHVSVLPGERKKNKMVPAKVAIRVVEAPYSLLEKSGLPFSVCFELQENKVDISLAAWTVRKSKSGISLQLFWPLNVDGNNCGSSVQPPRRSGASGPRYVVNNRRRRQRPRRRKPKATSGNNVQPHLSIPLVQSAPASGDPELPLDYKDRSAAVSHGGSDVLCMSGLDLSTRPVLSASASTSGDPAAVRPR